METITTTVRKWGNSFGVRLPVEVIKKNNIQIDEEIVIQIGKQKITTVGDLFALAEKHKLPPLKQSTQEIMDEIDRDLWFD